MSTMVPAYGRNPKSGARAIEDWETGLDWILRDVSSMWDGRYTSIRDFQDVEVKLRYNSLRDVVIYKPKGDEVEG